MRQILLIAAILLLAGCGAQKDMVKSREPVYREQVLQGQISMKDYFYLMDMERELNEMKGIKK